MGLPAPYYSHDGITIYRADCFEVLHELEGVGAFVTDVPYSSGGAFRGDRMFSTLSKYASSDSTQQQGIGFTGDNRDQRAFLAWCSLWMSAARAAAVEGATFATFIDWRQLPTISDAIVMEWAMANVSPGALVVDPFMGSRSTLVAAKRRGLRAIGIDVDGRQCDVAIRRLSQGMLPGLALEELEEFEDVDGAGEELDRNTVPAWRDAPRVERVPDVAAGVQLPILD